MKSHLSSGCHGFPATVDCTAHRKHKQTFHCVRCFAWVFSHSNEKINQYGDFLPRVGTDRPSVEFLHPHTIRASEPTLVQT